VRARARARVRACVREKPFPSADLSALYPPLHQA